MSGNDSFRDPFGTSQRAGIGQRNPGAIGTERGRTANNINRSGGHSPTALSNSTASSNFAIQLRRLPQTATSETVRSMLLFIGQDYLGAEFVAASADDQPYKTALARFSTMRSAYQAAQALHGKKFSDSAPEILAEVLDNTPNSEEASVRMSGRLFPEPERISPPQAGGSNRHQMNGSAVDGVSPTFSPSRLGNGSTFGPPIERATRSGRAMIQEDAADDDANQIMQDPGSFMTAERQSQFMQQGRRATAPHISMNGIAGRMGGLSINSNVGATMSPPMSTSGVTSPNRYNQMQSPVGGTWSPPAQTHHHGHGNRFSVAMSPTEQGPYQPSRHVQQFHQMPPVNPADQNPPCNTLYVGNLPLDTSEDELKSIFSQQRGYRRLCFRMKSQGPMCFVEFEDVGMATRVLNNLYGTMLSNSVRGGIRLSYSKNPLGVRGPASHANQMNSNGAPGMGPGASHFNSPLASYSGMGPPGFATASRPPPGLQPPPGFAQPQRSGSIASNGHNAQPSWEAPQGFPSVQREATQDMKGNGSRNTSARPQEERRNDRNGSYNY